MRIHIPQGLGPGARATPSGEAPMLGLDAKSQVTVKYRSGKPGGASLRARRIHAAPSTRARQPRTRAESWKLRTFLRCCLQGWVNGATRSGHVTPAGKFVIGGPDGDFLG